MLWLCVIIAGSILTVIAKSDKDPPAWLISIAVLPVITVVVGFLFLLIFDRDKLQSEDYQIRKRSLELIQEKGQSFPISATSIEAISNPNPVKTSNSVCLGTEDRLFRLGFPHQECR
jgi:hypothetical protein